MAQCLDEVARYSIASRLSGHPDVEAVAGEVAWDVS